MKGANIFQRMSEEVDLSKGLLVYPCCAKDYRMLEPLYRFVRSTVFVDIRSPYDLGLSSRIWKSIPDSDLLKACGIGKEMSNKNYAYQICQCQSGPNIEAYWCCHDAVDFVNKLQDSSVSVFFHRCDGPTWGEGSSGLAWFQEELFAQLVRKMSGNGYIITDGSCGYTDGTRCAWESVWSHRKVTVDGNETALYPPDFEWNNTVFTCFGRYPSRNDRESTYIWKISKKV